MLNFQFFMIKILLSNVRSFKKGTVAFTTTTPQVALQPQHHKGFEIQNVDFQYSDAKVCANNQQ